MCQAIKDDLVRQGLPAAKIDVVYSGTDTDRFDPARVDGARRSAGSSALDAATPLVTQIGVREPKGNDDLLRAFARVRAARPDARLLLVGARPEKRSPLETLARACGLGDAVTIWGYRDDVPDGARRRRRSRSTPPTKGSGSPARSASRWPWRRRSWRRGAMGNPELVGHEEHGLLVPPRDPEAMAAAILRLLARSGLGPERLGRAGRARVVAGFSTRAKVERLERLYARLARGRCRPR